MKKNEIPEKNLSKVVKFQNLVGKCCNVRKKFANFLIIALGAETFGSKMVTIFEQHNNEKICKLCIISSTHYNIFQLTFGIFKSFKKIKCLNLLKGSFRKSRFYCLDQKLVYNGNCLLHYPTVMCRTKHLPTLNN